MRGGGRGALAITAVVATACSSSSSSSAPRGEAARATDAAAVAGAAGDARAAGSAAGGATVDAAAADAVRVPRAARVLLTSVTRGWDDIQTELTLWRRDAESAPWRAVRSWPGTVGRAGLAWGDGLHGGAAPPGRDGPRKREGDGKSPAGMFGFGGTYGYARTPPAATDRPYTAVDATWHCVDDPGSRHYNRIVDADEVEADWASAEDMRRRDALYTWVIEVRHNGSATRGAGSCIFLHVWGGPDAATAGCTAMARPDIEALFAELDSTRGPVFVQLPAAEYAALAAAWQLPTK